MCSIIGCRWSDSVSQLLVKGLKRMEYRGYDSVGVATLDNETLTVRKGVGKVAEVNEAENLDQMPGNTGVGHTRWATHGVVCSRNAHPHLDTIWGKVAIVHNGIIDNYAELKADLNCEFRSDTDSEVIANLLGQHYGQTNDPRTAMVRTLEKLKGQFAFIALFDDGTICGAKNHKPLILGIGNFGYFLSSDVLGFIEFADSAIYPRNREFVVIEPEKIGGIAIYNFEGRAVRHKVVKLSKELADVYKHDYAHFTLKEINEQPETVLKAGENSVDEIADAARIIQQSQSVYITGSGTSYNAGLVGKYIFNKYARLRLEPIISSEAQFSDNGFDHESVLIALSQSGESADVLDTVDSAKARHSKVISIVNTMTSSLAGISDVCIGLNCGPEIGVAATKSFTSQLAVLYRLTEETASLVARKQFGEAGLSRRQVSEAMKKVLKETSIIERIAGILADVNDIYVLGRGVHYAIASEASLKLKELAYVHAEGLPGGELKHGPLALMDEQTYILLINPKDETYNETIITGKQIKSRGAKIIGISDVAHEMYDYWLRMPAVDPIQYPLVEIIPIQLLAYYIAVAKDTDPDYPKNLAKSVTVK